MIRRRSFLGLIALVLTGSVLALSACTWTISSNGEISRHDKTATGTETGQPPFTF